MGILDVRSLNASWSRTSGAREEEPFAVAGCEAWDGYEVLVFPEYVVRRLVPLRLRLKLGNLPKNGRSMSSKEKEGDAKPRRSTIWHYP